MKILQNGIPIFAKKQSLLNIQALRAAWLYGHTAMLSGKIFRKSLILCLKLQGMKMFVCLCLYLKAFYRRRKIMLRASLLNVHG